MDAFKGGGTILIGNGRLKETFSSAKSVFVVCDPFLANSGNIKYLTDVFEDIGLQYKIFSEIEPDPSVDIITRGISQLVDTDADIVVGFGGGSAIDACKAMLFFARKEGYVNNDIKFIAIPTTSGTGSEVTDFSVITDKEKGLKYPIVDSSLLPDIALLDAELTVTVPAKITAITGMDVVTHAIEAMVSKNATDFSDACAEKSIKLVRNSLLKAYRQPDDLEARQSMHNASCLAGIAFNNAGLGLNHGMAHALGGKFHLPHGQANAVLLPYVMGFNAGCYDNLTDCAKSYARIARLIHVDASSIRMSALNLIRSVKKFIVDLGLPSTIKDCGIDEEEFMSNLDEMALAALNDKCTGTNPREADIEEIKKIYVHAYYGNILKGMEHAQKNK